MHQILKKCDKFLLEGCTPFNIAATSFIYIRLPLLIVFTILSGLTQTNQRCLNKEF